MLAVFDPVDVGHAGKRFVFSGVFDPFLDNLALAAGSGDGKQVIRVGLSGDGGWRVFGVEDQRSFEVVGRADG